MFCIRHRMREGEVQQVDMLTSEFADEARAAVVGGAWSSPRVSALPSRKKSGFSLPSSSCRTVEKNEHLFFTDLRRERIFSSTSLYPYLGGDRFVSLRAHLFYFSFIRTTGGDALRPAGLEARS